MRFAVSLLICLLLWLPLAAIGLLVVWALLLTSWDGRTTWFGNFLYGRNGNHHVPANPTFWQQWIFLAIRNPVSNFGKFTLSRSGQAWLEERWLGRIGVLYGWKNPDPRIGFRRPFVFRPLLR